MSSIQEAFDYSKCEMMAEDQTFESIYYKLTTSESWLLQTYQHNFLLIQSFSPSLAGQS